MLICPNTEMTQWVVSDRFLKSEAWLHLFVIGNGLILYTALWRAKEYHVPDFLVNESEELQVSAKSLLPCPKKPL